MLKFVGRGRHHRRSGRDGEISSTSEGSTTQFNEGSTTQFNEGSTNQFNEGSTVQVQFIYPKAMKSEQMKPAFADSSSLISLIPSGLDKEGAG